MAPGQGLEDLPDDEIERAFRANIVAIFHTCKAALQHMQPGSSIINAVSAQSYKPSPELPIQRGIRVDAVAPGPVWTPPIPATMPVEKVKSFGEQAPMLA